MNSILNNAWVVGIGGGILSGIIVTLISRTFLSRRENREYLQRVGAANRDVVYAIRPDISEGLVPSREVIEALIRATARKFSVDPKDMYHTPEITEELTKEIMDSSFISAQTKRQYCDKLSEIALPLPQSPETETGSAGRERALRSRETELAEYRERMATMMSAVLGVTIALMTTLLVVVRERGGAGLSDFQLPKSVWALFPALLGIVAVVLGFASIFFFREVALRSGRARPKLPSEHEDRPE